MVDFSTAREMASYLKEPVAMQVGTRGKTGYLFLGFELDKNGKSILRNLERRVPLIVQQALYFDEEIPGMPCVYILSSGGPNVDGDRYEQSIEVRSHAMAHISTGAATKLAEMCYNYSGLSQHIVLEDDAYLEFIPEPIIPCHNTRYIANTLLEVAPTATAFYSEIYMGGRKYYGKGELFDYDILSITTSGKRLGGEYLFREKFIIRPKSLYPKRVGIMDDYDVFANIIVMTPKEHADDVYQNILAFIDKKIDIAIGASYLPNNGGLIIRILGREVEPVKKKIRELCSLVRISVKGKPLPKEFVWR